MSWFGDGFTSLKGQLTNLAKVLSEEPNQTDGESSQSGLLQARDESARGELDSPEGSQKGSESTAESGGSGWTDIQLVHPSDPSFNYASTLPRRDEQTQTESVEDQAALILSLQHTIEQLSQENESLSLNVASLGRAAADLEAQVAVSQDENANLSTGLEELDIQHQRAIENVMVVRDETMKEYEILKVKYAELEEEMRLIKEKDDNRSKDKDKQNRERELIRELEDRDRDLECLESENASLRETLKDLMRDQVDPVKETLAPISEQDTEEIEAMEKQIECLKKEIKQGLKDQSEKDQQIVLLNEKLSELVLENESLKQLEQKIVQKNNDEQTYRDQIDTLTKQIDELNNKVVLLKNSNLESQSLIEHLESQIESGNNAHTSSELSPETLDKINCLEEENRLLHSKIPILESRLSETTDQKTHYQKECESKDRKMCQILLESNASEHECKSELEQQEIKYKRLVEEFQSFKSDSENKVKENKIEIDRLNCLIRENNEIIVDNAVNSEFSDKLLLLEQENDKIMAESAKMKIENEELCLKIKQLEENNETIQKELSHTKSEHQMLKKQYEFDSKSFETKLNQLSQESQQYQIDKEVFVQKEIELKNQLKIRDDEIGAYKTLKQQFDLTIKEKVSSVENEFTNRITELENNLSTLQVENESLQSSLEAKVKDSLDIIENKDQIIKEISTEQEKLLADLSRLQNEISVLTSQKCQVSAEEYEKEREIFMRKVESMTEQNAQLLSDVVRLNTEHAALKNKLVFSHNEELKVLQDNLAAAQNELKSTSELLTVECNQLKSKLAQVESERDTLFKNIQVKHNECIQLQTEVLQLNELLKNEQIKLEAVVVEKAQLEIKCEKLSSVETEGDSLKKDNSELTQEVKRLKEQLDNASDLIKEIKRTEAEGQSAEDSSAKNFKCAEGCEKTHEELNKLSWALHNEQVSNKTLLRQISDLKDKFEKSEVQLRRLQVHLVEVEQNQSQELSEMEQMRAKLEAAEDRLRQSSTAYTSANIRVNQQVESLTHQVQTLSDTKEKVEKELSIAEDAVLKQQAAVTNLQAVLHQFQLDKQRDIEFETERLRQQLRESQEKYQHLNDDMKKTMDQMGEMKKGLEAASRLSDQLDRKTQVIETLKSEVTVLKEKLEKEKVKVNEIHSSVEGKVDRNLVKNLLIGYIIADDRSKTQVLRVLASVLELNLDERKKVSLEAQPHGQQQSLSEAFIKFLELESQPKPHLVLSVPSTTEGTSSSRRTSQSSNSSLLLSAEVGSTLSHSPVIPPYPLRSNHSILKDLLKDSTPPSNNPS